MTSAPRDGYVLLAVMLAGLAMLGPFSVDTYLPSFPAIRADLGISVLQVQQTLSTYLLAFAVMMLFHGTLSDSFGRRPVILGSLAIFVLASLGCGAAREFHQLLAFRALQGLSAGAGMVVGRAVIRDSLEGHAAQRLMALVTLIFGVAPAIAPVVGGWLQVWFGWQAIFLFLALYGAALLALCYGKLPETLAPERRQPFALAPLARNYARLGGSIPLLLLCLVLALNFSGFFIYIVSAPAFVYNLLKLGQTQFAWLFLPGIAGVMLGAFISGRAAGRLASRQTIAIAYGIMGSAALFNVSYCALAEPALPWSVLPVFVYACGMALAMPSITLIALELFPHNRGMTASLQAFGQQLLAAATAGILSPLLSYSAITLALGMAVPVIGGWLSWGMFLHVHREARHA